MTFDQLTTDSDCDCLSLGAVENTTDEFLHAVNGPTLGPRDFRSLWEQGRKCAPSDCAQVCLRKGVSTNLASEIEETLEKYRTTVRFSPRMQSRRSHYCRFRCRPGAGMFRHTPRNSDRTHFTFYKSDEFDMASVDVLEIAEL